MGYDSRLLIGKRIVHLNQKNHELDWIYFQTLCRYELCVMGSNSYSGKTFYDLFDTEIDFDMFVDNPDESTRVDAYGTHCKYTVPEQLIPWLEQFAEDDSYWRIPPLISLLKSIKDEKNLVIVHYGH